MRKAGVIAHSKTKGIKETDGQRCKKVYVWGSIGE
jgi:hypothetical protein